MEEAISLRNGGCGARMHEVVVLGWSGSVVTYWERTVQIIKRAHVSIPDNNDDSDNNNTPQIVMVIIFDGNKITLIEIFLETAGRPRQDADQPWLLRQRYDV